MYLKKLIGAFTALIMTVTVFAGSAVSVSAYSEAPNTSSFKLNITCGTDSSGKSWTGYADSSEIGNFIGQSGHTFEHENKTYIVKSGQLNYDSQSETFYADVTVSEAVTLDIPDGINGATINVTSSTVGSYTEDGNYVTAKSATVSIIIMPPSGQQITDVKINDKSQPRANDTLWHGTHIMDDNATLSVTFAGTHSIKVSSSENGKINVSHTTAKAGDTVTVYPMPSEGYRIASLTYTHSGTTENINLDEETQSYTFTMPDAAVTINATFEKIPVYPSTEATHKGDYDDPNKGDSASLWEGTLVGQGTAYCPKVTVTLKGGKSQKAIGQTTVDGNSSVTIAVVVDKIKNEIDSVMLEGVANGSDISQTFPIEKQDTVNKEVD